MHFHIYFGVPWRPHGRPKGDVNKIAFRQLLEGTLEVESTKLRSISHRTEPTKLCWSAVDRHRRNVGIVSLQNLRSVSHRSECRENSLQISNDRMSTYM